MTTWLERSAHERGISKGIAWGALATPLVGLSLVIGIRVVNLGVFRVVMEEDGVVEWLQFLFFTTAAVISALIARHRWQDGQRSQATLYGVVAMGLLFVSGEEIAWGTRLMALETPEWLREINLQEEVTLHNVAGVLFWFNMVLLVTALYAMVADPLNWRTRFAERWDAGRVLFVPPFFLFTAFGVMAIVRIYRLIAGGPSQYTITKLIEWAELCYAAALLGFVWLALRELRNSHGAVTSNFGLDESAAKGGSLHTQDP